MFPQNVGSVDKMVRVALALLIVVLYFTNVISGTVAIILSVLAIILILTSAVSFCPLYLPFGFSTKKK